MPNFPLAPITIPPHLLAQRTRNLAELLARHNLPAGLAWQPHPKAPALRQYAPQPGNATQF